MSWNAKTRRGGNMKLNEIQSEEDIALATQLFCNKQDCFGKKQSLIPVMDAELISILPEKLLNQIYEILDKHVEHKIENLLQSKGVNIIPVGTKVKLRIDFSGQYKKGSIVTITGRTRFKENTFGNGWYKYEGDNFLVMYDFEFDVLYSPIF